MFSTGSGSVICSIVPAAIAGSGSLSLRSLIGTCCEPVSASVNRTDSPLTGLSVSFATRIAASASASTGPTPFAGTPLSLLETCSRARLTGGTACRYTPRARPPIVRLLQCVASVFSSVTTRSLVPPLRASVTSNSLGVFTRSLVPTGLPLTYTFAYPSADSNRRRTRKFWPSQPLGVSNVRCHATGTFISLCISPSPCHEKWPGIWALLQS